MSIQYFANLVNLIKKDISKNRVTKNIAWDTQLDQLFNVFTCPTQSHLTANSLLNVFTHRLSLPDRCYPGCCLLCWDDRLFLSNLEPFSSTGHQCSQPTDTWIHSERNKNDNDKTVHNCFPFLVTYKILTKYQKFQESSLLFWQINKYERSLG